VVGHIEGRRRVQSDFTFPHFINNRPKQHNDFVILKEINCIKMGKDVIRKYYQGIMDQIRTEVDLINSNFHHNGLKGEGNENKLRDIIKKFIPERYGVDTGIVIDRDGNQSKQCDIIIYDKFNHPQLLGLSSVKMFPVDLVHAVIEVKTTLDKTSARKSIENIKSVRNLNYIKEDFRVYPTDPVEKITKNTVMLEVYSTSPPFGLVFGFSSKPISNTTFSDWFIIKDQSERHLYPSHICCLDQGILYINSSNNNKYRDITSWIYPYNEDNDTSFHLSKDEKLGSKKMYLHKDWLYPVVKVGTERLLIDQSKILLNFILLISSLLDKKKISPNINYREAYLPPELKNVLLNDKDTLKWRKEDYPQYAEKNIEK
jgi:hypothetical protein